MKICRPICTGLQQSHCKYKSHFNIKLEIFLTVTTSKHPRIEISSSSILGTNSRLILVYGQGTEILHVQEV